MILLTEGSLVNLYSYIYMFSTNNSITYNILLFLLPFTNEIANLVKSAFSLPAWVYTSCPTTLAEVTTKLGLDSLSLFGVVLNLLEASSTGFNIEILTVLSLILLTFSFVLPTFIIPFLVESSIPGRTVLAALVILLFAYIDRRAVLWAEHKKSLRATESTRGKGTYYIIAFISILVAALYASHAMFENKWAVILGGGCAALIISHISIQKTFEEPSRVYDPISKELVQ